MARRTERLVRIWEVGVDDDVRVNSNAKTKPTQIRSKMHLGENRWRLILATGEHRTYEADDQIILVEREETPK